MLKFKINCWNRFDEKKLSKILHKNIKLELYEINSTIVLSNRKEVLKHLKNMYDTLLSMNLYIGDFDASDQDNILRLGIHYNDVHRNDNRKIHISEDLITEFTIDDDLITKLKIYPKNTKYYYIDNK